MTSEAIDFSYPQNPKPHGKLSRMDAQPPNNGPTNSNGSPSKVLWWILGGIIGPMVLALANTVQTTSSRVTALEVEFREIKHNLDLITNKLDRLIERSK